MLDEDVMGEVTALVRAGFFDRDRIVEIVCEELHDPAELDPAQVKAAVAAAIGEHEAQKATWPERTDCDRLTAAFAAVRAQGILALENAGIDQGDGYDLLMGELAGQPDASALTGYCYYHQQDLDRAVAGAGLYLAFGPLDPREEQTRGRQIGAVIAEALTQQGLSVRWKGTFADRIYIPAFDWKRR